MSTNNPNSGKINRRTVSTSKRNERVLIPLVALGLANGRKILPENQKTNCARVPLEKQNIIGLHVEKKKQPSALTQNTSRKIQVFAIIILVADAVIFS